MSHVAVYCRASVATELRVSCSRQAELGSEFAETNWPGVPVVVYTDNNISGANPDANRPAYNDLLDALRLGRVAQVVCSEQSRLTRQPAQWEELLVTLAVAGITTVYTTSKGPITVEAGNRLTSRLMGVIDAEEAERAKVRITVAHKHLAAEGRPGGGRPYGYSYGIGADGRSALLIVPEQAEIVRRMAAAVLAGSAVSVICKMLNAEGVPTARGGTTWRPTAIRQIFESPTLAGLRFHHGELVARGRWVPILDEATWRQVADRLTDTITVTGIDGAQHRVERKRARPRTHLLTGGLARCGVCGSPLIAARSVRRNGPAVRAYACHRGSGPDACSKVSMSPAERIEELVEAAVLESMDSPVMVRRLAAGDGGERQRLATAVAGAEAKMHEAAALYGAGEIDRQTWAVMHSAAKSSNASARSALDTLHVPGVTLPEASELRQGWPDLTLAQRRAVLDLAIERVVIGPAKPGTRLFDSGRISIEWRSP